MRQKNNKQKQTKDKKPLQNIKNTIQPSTAKVQLSTLHYMTVTDWIGDKWRAERYTGKSRGDTEHPETGAQYRVRRVGWLLGFLENHGVKMKVHCREDVANTKWVCKTTYTVREWPQSSECRGTTEDIEIEGKGKEILRISGLINRAILEVPAAVFHNMIMLCFSKGGGVAWRGRGHPGAAGHNQHWEKVCLISSSTFPSSVGSSHLASIVTVWAD